MAGGSSLTWLYAAGGRSTGLTGVGFSPAEDCAGHQRAETPPDTRLDVVPLRTSDLLDLLDVIDLLTDIGDMP